MKRILFFVLCILLVSALLGNETYIVKKGDSLISIASKFGSTVNEIKENNKLSNNNILVGQKLIIKNKVAPNRIYYTIKNGDNLTSIAKRHNVTISKLREWNNLKSSSIRVGQKLIVGIESNNNTLLPKNSVQNIETAQHIVKKGETLSAISRKYNISVENLVRFNQLLDTLIVPGQRIWLQDGQASNNSTNSNKSSQSETRHVVKRGENLFRIAQDYKVSVDEIRSWNHLSNANIRVGQTLIIKNSPSIKNSNQSLRQLPLNQQSPNLSVPAILPLNEVNVISEFGLRSGKMHQGIDLSASPGTPIYAVLPGKVVFSGVQRGFGNVIILEHENHIMTLYGHNEQNLVLVDDIVTQGQIIATIGNTGNTSTNHVHFEYRLRGIARNPRELLKFW